jgi:hypothetical protein
LRPGKLKQKAGIPGNAENYRFCAARNAARQLATLRAGHDRAGKESA